MLLDLRVTVNSGVAAVTLPPQTTLEVEIQVNSGGAVVAGRSYGRGKHRFSIGEGVYRGNLRIEVNSGTARIQ